jgi:hypothetical protein
MRLALIHRVDRRGLRTAHADLMRDEELRSEIYDAIQTVLEPHQ